MTYVLIAAVVLVFFALFFIFLPLTAVKVPKITRCGNGVCEEDCFACPVDCACNKGKVCFNDLGKCESIPSDASALLQSYDSWSFVESWTEGTQRAFLVQADGKAVIIKGGNITELDPL